MSEAGKMNLGQGPGMLLNQAQKAADSKEYLVEGAKLFCVNGSNITQLKLPTGHGYTSGGKKKVNCKDCKACENIPYFGECRKNEKDHKCEGFMDLVDKWENTAVGTGKAETVGGEEAISMSSVLLCKKGGVIIPVTSGQGYDGKINWAAFLKRYQNVFRWVAGKNKLCQVYGKDPINMNTGNYIYEKEDLVINGNLPLSFQLFYNAMDCGDQQVLGEGWNHNYGVRLIKLKEEELLGIVMEDGRELPYCRKLGDSYAPVMGDGGILRKSENGYQFEQEDGTVYKFDQEGKLCSQKDRNGNNRKFTYNSDGLLECVENGTGGSLNYTYNQERKLIYVQDHTGRKISLKFQYGKLRWFTNSMGKTYTYEYNENGKVNGIITPRDILGVKNEYDGVDRVRKQIMPDGGVTEFRYDDENNRTYMLEQNGNLVIYECDKLMRNVRTIYEDGEEIFEYNDRNQKIRYTDKNGNTFRYAYDNQGNMSKVIDPLGQKFYMTYDKRNLLVNIKYPNGTSIKNSYNENRKLIETVDRCGYSTKIEYVNGNDINRVLQADGTEWGFQYNGKGHISQITDPLGNSRSFFYNELGQQEKYIDGNGNQTLYSYNKAGKLEEVTNAAGDKRRYEYNDSGRIIEIKDFDNSIHQMEYDACGRCCKYTDPEGNVTSYEYDGMGKMVKKSLPNGGAYLYSYSHLGHIQTAVDPLGNTTTFWHDPNGNCIKVMEPNGAETVYAYDALNRLISRTEVDGFVINYEYDTSNNVTKTMDNYGNEVLTEYDLAGRPAKVTDVYGNCSIFSYDCQGQIVNKTDGAGRKTDYSYYPGKLLKKVQYCDGTSKEFFYDGNRNITKIENQDSFTVNFTYDCLDRCIAITDSKGNKKSYSYEGNKNITSMVNANGNITRFEYSLNGNITKVVDALGNSTSYEYDCMGKLLSAMKLGRKESETHLYQRNLLGQIEAITNALGNTEYYEYDKNGNIIKKTDRDGGESCFTYSLAGLLENIKYTDDKQVTLKYDGLRRLNEIEDWCGTTKVEWGVYEHLKSITDYKGRKTSYEFSPMGKLLKMNYPNGKNVKYSYDECLRLSNLADGIQNVGYRYNKNGLLQEKLFLNGLKVDYSYNEAGQLTSIMNKNDGKILDQYHYTYDPVGNKTGINKLRTGIPAESGDFQYKYNSLNQIIKVLRDGKELRQFAYDVFGNRIFKKEGEIETNYIYNANNQLIREMGEEIKDYEYDLRGNLRTVSVDGIIRKSYEFGIRNHMESVTDEKGVLHTYQYNGLGHRISTQVYDGNTSMDVEYILDFSKRGNNLLEKIENGEVEEYIWDNNIVVATGKSGNKQYLNDELGSTIRTCFSNGRDAGLYGYSEFGEITYKNERADQPFGFTGYQWDENSGTYYAQAREYSPSTGSFISEDIVNDIVGLPETLNHYTYCWGNPCKWVDINGQFTQREANQYITGYYLDEYERAFNSWKDDVSNTIDGIGKSVGNGISSAATAVSEFWGNKIYGVDTELYTNGDFTLQSHTGGEIIVINRTKEKYFSGWSLNISLDIPTTNISTGFTLSGEDINPSSWKTLCYYEKKELDEKLSYSGGYGYNNEGLYFNNTLSGKTDNIPIPIPNGVIIDSHANVTWSISEDKTILPWDAIGGVCVVTAGVVVLAVVGPEVAIGGLIAGVGQIIANVGNYVNAACGG